MSIASAKPVCCILLALAFGNAQALEEGSFEMITMDYHTDENHNVVFFGASAYLGLESRLQEKFSVQLISQDGAHGEPEFFWGIAASGRYSPVNPVSPFVGLGVSFGESYVCKDQPESDDPVRVFHGGEEVCLQDILLSAFGEYGIYWLINKRVFLEVSSKHNYTSKQVPFDSVVKGFSLGFRY